MIAKLLSHLKSCLGIKSNDMPISSWLPAEVKNRRDGVEKYFCIPFAKLPCVLDEDMRFLIRAISMPNWSDTILAPFEEEQLHAIKERLQTHLNVYIDARSIRFITLCSDRYAIAMMFLTYIQWWAFKNNVRHVSFSHIKDQIFPNGLPDKAALKEMWYSQKVNHNGGSDNLIDYQSALKSIQFA